MARHTIVVVDNFLRNGDWEMIGPHLNSLTAFSSLLPLDTYGLHVGSWKRSCASGATGSGSSRPSSRRSSSSRGSSSGSGRSGAPTSSSSSSRHRDCCLLVVQIVVTVDELEE